MNTRTKTTAGFQYARNLEGVEGSVTDLYYVVDGRIVSGLAAREVTPMFCGNGTKVHHGFSYVATLTEDIEIRNEYGRVTRHAAGTEVRSEPQTFCGANAYHRSGWYRNSNRSAAGAEVDCAKCIAKYGEK